MLPTHGQQRRRSVHEQGETVSIGGRAVSATAIAPGDSRLAERLRREIRGAVLFDRADRGRYATDASIYQVQPIGVIVPEEIGDVAAAMSIAREEGIPVLPRGGGTSQCGQTVNRALLIELASLMLGPPPRPRRTSGARRSEPPCGQHRPRSPGPVPWSGCRAATAPHHGTPGAHASWWCG